MTTTASFLSTTIPNDELVATENCCCLNEGSDKQKREKAYALMMGAIHPSIEPETHKYFLVLGEPPETATMNERKKMMTERRIPAVIQ